jgi:DNA-binding LacI/PurR family transcriptional regulator
MEPLTVMKPPPEPTPLNPREQSRLQMADIARLAGVSPSPVSRALNGSDLVNDDTKRRVADLARSLNYSINIGAKNLRLKQNKTVAVVVPYDAANRQHVSDPFFLSMLGGLADALTDRGYDMLLSRVDSDRLDQAASLYDSGRAIGVILIGQWGHHDQLNDLASRRVPLAVWGAQMPQQLYCTVGGDNTEGGRAATRHLLQTGRKHVAFLGNRDLPEVALRFAGYQAALKTARVKYREELYVSAPFTANGGPDAIKTLLARGERFDALFCCSDLLAITAINAMRAEGIHVPHDVAVVGYDDVEMGQHFHPPLTTIRQSIGSAGPALVDALIEQLEGRKPIPSVLATTLIVRGTT